MSILFGMFGVYQEKKKHISRWVGAYSANWAGYPFLSYKSGANGIVNLNINFDESGTAQPINFNEIDQRLGFVSSAVSTYTQKIDGRAVLHPEIDTKSFIASSFSGVFLDNAYSCRSVVLYRFNGWIGIGRPFVAEWVFHRPDLVEHIESPGGLGGAGEGNYFDGGPDYGNVPYKIPYFRNLQTITLLSSGNNQSYYIRRIEGTFPESLKSIQIISTTNDFLSIEKPLPPNLKILTLEITGSYLPTDLARLIEPITDLEHIALTRPNYTIGSQIQIPGVLDFSKWQNLKSIRLRSTVTTDILLHPSLSSLQCLMIPSCFGLTNTKKISLLNLFQASPIKEFLNISDCRIILTGFLLENTTSSGFVGMDLTANRLTGEILLPNPFTGPITLGNSAAYVDTNSTHFINNFPTVDISGLTTDQATLDISNCKIQNLNLPVDKVLTSFSFGGNKLDHVTDPSIFSKLLAVCRLSTLQSWRASISTAADHPATYTDQWGQDSVNGLGNNLDFSPLIRANEIQAQGCKITGEITLPNTTFLNAVVFNKNNITGIAGTNTFLNVSNFQFRENPNFNVDLTRFPNLSFFRIQGNNVMTVFDLSGRTGTGIWNENFAVQNNSVLEEIIFPTNPLSFQLNNNTATFNFRDCPQLERLTNFSNWRWNGTPPLNRTALLLLARSPKLAKKIVADGALPFIPSGFTWYYIDVDSCSLTDAEMGFFVDHFYNNRETLWFLYASRFTLLIRTNSEPMSGTYTPPANFRYQSIGSITKGAITKFTLTNAGATLNILENDVVTFYRGHNVNEDRQWANLLHGQKFMLKNKSGFVFDVYSEDGTTPLNTSTGFPSGYLANSAVVVKYGDPPIGNRQKLYITALVMPLSVSI